MVLSLLAQCKERLPLRHVAISALSETTSNSEFFPSALKGCTRVEPETQACQVRKDPDITGLEGVLCSSSAFKRCFFTKRQLFSAKSCYTTSEAN